MMETATKFWLERDSFARTAEHELRVMRLAKPTPNRLRHGAPPNAERQLGLLFKEAAAYASLSIEVF